MSASEDKLDQKSRVRLNDTLLTIRRAAAVADSLATLTMFDEKASAADAEFGLQNGSFTHSSTLYQTAAIGLLERSRKSLKSQRPNRGWSREEEGDQNQASDRGIQIGPRKLTPAQLIERIHYAVDRAADAIWVAETVLKEQACDIDLAASSVLHLAGWQPLDKARADIEELKKVLGLSMGGGAS